MLRLAFFVVGLLSALVSWEVIFSHNRRTEAEGVKNADSIVVAYFQALARRDYASARRVAVGSAWGVLASTPTEGDRATISMLDVRPVSVAGDWARMHVSIEASSADGAGTPNAEWYTADVVRTPEGWRVLSVAESDPLAIPVSVDASASTTGAPETLKQYLSRIVAGDWDGARALLVGPARTAAERTAPLLERGKLVREVSNLQIEKVLSQGRVLALRASYRADGRPVSALAFLYHLGPPAEAWRIWRLVPLGGGG